MVTGYVDVESRKVIHEAGWMADDGFPEGIRPAMLVFNGMLLKVGARMITPLWNRNLPAYLDLAVSFQLEDIDPPLGRDEEEELGDLLDRFSKYAIRSLELNIDEESAAYLRDNLHRVVDFLAPKLREGHLTLYQCRYGKSLKKNGAFLFLDLSDPKNPWCFYPVFGLKAVTQANGFVPWRPGSKESYLPDLRTRRATKSSLDTGADPSKYSFANLSTAWWSSKSMDPASSGVDPSPSASDPGAFSSAYSGFFPDEVTGFFPEEVTGLFHQE